MFKKSKKPIICLLLIACLFATAVPVFAQSQFGFEYATALSLGTRDLRATVMQAINVLLGFLGVAAIGIVLYGGYLYMTSGGASDKVEKAKKVLINGAVGLAIILSSYAIAFFIIHALTKITGSGGDVCNNNGTCQAGETCSNCSVDCGDCYSPPPIGQSFAVSWVDPDNAETNVSLCRLIQMKFNNQIDPDTIDNMAAWEGSVTVGATTTKANVNLWVEIDGGLAAGNTCTDNNKCASGVCSDTCQGDLVPGEITIWPTARGLSYNNTEDFEINATYKITIKSDAVTPSGLENTGTSRLTLGDYSWTFTTGTLTDTTPPTVDISSIFPADGATDVCLSSIIRAKFSESMDVSSLLATYPSNPMDTTDKNSLYINPNISGFDKTVPSPDTLIANPKEFYTAFTDYMPTLDSDVIKDSCGNKLDGDADGIAEESVGKDDYTLNPDDWKFTTGNTAECTPEIATITSNGYYDDIITITGNYFTGGSVIFNNNVNIFSGGANSCFDAVNYIPDPAKECVVSWADDQINVKLPSTGGASNGTETGNVVVEVGVKESNFKIFTLLSPRIDNILPNKGGIDQFLTLSGSGFGASQEANNHVYFRKDKDIDGDIELLDTAELIEANYPCDGSAGWNDEQIIISVPDNVNFADGEDW
ncbi:MAG: Ig-like domain-containing protein, partial [bacterium]